MTTISLLYHDVIPEGDFRYSGFAGADADVYKLDRGRFAGHLASISDCVAPSARVLAPQAAESSTAHAGGTAVMLTFDDGGVSAIEQTAPMLEAAGWRGHFFITTGKIGEPGFLDPSQIRQLHQRGHVIGSHSVSHPPRMSHCTTEQLHHEWRQSIQQLSDIVGCPVTTASVPGGFYAPRVAETAAEAGIRILFHSEPVSYQRRLFDCLLLGRYSIQRHTPARTAAAIAAGAWGPRFQQVAYWNTKKVLKSVGGKYWLALRKKIFASSQPRESQ